MNNLPHFVKPKNILRLVILALFIVSMLGPWMFDRLFIPAEYPCNEPVVRLEGDFCGYPMPGWGIDAAVSGRSNGGVGLVPELKQLLRTLG